MIDKKISIEEPDISHKEISNIITHDPEDDDTTHSHNNSILTFTILDKFTDIQHIFLRKNYITNGSNVEFTMIFVTTIKNLMSEDIKLFIERIGTYNSDVLLMRSIERNIDNIICVLCKNILFNGERAITEKNYFDIV